MREAPRHTQSPPQLMAQKRTPMNKSVKKALSVLELFTEQAETLSIKEIAEKLHTRSGTIFPVLATLMQYGYLERHSESKKYSLGLALLGRVRWS